MRIPLSQLPVGHTAILTELSVCGGKRRRLMDLGFLPGAAVTALQAAPWGDPVAYGVGDAVVALRKCDTAHIFVLEK